MFDSTKKDLKDMLKDIDAGHLQLPDFQRDYIWDDDDVRNLIGSVAKGYPIGTGLIEGACGYLVKNRMEGSGMRWSRAGAEAMLQQRAVKLNGDWDDFWSFHIDSERDRLYPTTYKSAA